MRHIRLSPDGSSFSIAKRFFIGFNTITYQSESIQKLSESATLNDRLQECSEKNLSFSDLSRLFLPFADGKSFAISDGKHVSYDRKNLFSLI